MKKLLFCFLTLYVSVFVSAQDADVTEIPQKPLKEDFYHTWVTEAGSGLGKGFYETTFNESTYVQVARGMLSPIKSNQKYAILSWEEAVNTGEDAEEYLYGFKISVKNTNSVERFSIFMNSDKTKYLYVFDFGSYTQYYIYTKKETKKRK